MNVDYTYHKENSRTISSGFSPGNIINWPRAYETCALLFVILSFNRLVEQRVSGLGLVIANTQKYQESSRKGSDDGDGSRELCGQRTVVIFCLIVYIYIYIYTYLN